MDAVERLALAERLLSTGKGDPDLAKARNLLEDAAASGLAKAQLRLARLHLNGAFGGGMWVEAMMWARMALASADTKTLTRSAEASVRRLTRKLSPGQLAEVDEWLAELNGKKGHTGKRAFLHRLHAEIPASCEIAIGSVCELAEVIHRHMEADSDDTCDYEGPPKNPVRVIHGGSTVRIPKPTLLIDSREQTGQRYNFIHYKTWFAGMKVKAMKTGDYSLVEWEREISIERKTLDDLIVSTMCNRSRFLENCERLAQFKRKAIVVESTLRRAKSGYEFSQAHPNAVVGTIFAIQERWDIPVIWAGNRTLAEETVAHILSKYHALRWLEKNGHPRHFIDGDV